MLVRLIVVLSVALALVTARVATSSPLFVYIGYKVAWGVARPSVVEIHIGGQFAATGSVVKAPNGKTYTLTNRHVCIDSETKLSVDHTPLKVIEISDSMDLCVMEAAAGHPALEMSSHEPRIGSLVWSLGYPAGLPLQVSPGKIIGHTADVLFSPTADWQLTVHGTYGSSGSPVIDLLGNLVGVISFTDNEGRMGGPTWMQLKTFLGSLP